MPYEILACGFNAHGQLLASKDALPADIFTPTVIARAEASARVLFAGWSETLLELDNKLHHRGAGPLQPLPHSCKPPYRAFGDGLELKVVLGGREDAAGDDDGVQTTTAYARAPEAEGAWQRHTLAERTAIIAIAGNGKVLSTHDGTAIHAHPTLASLLARHPPTATHAFPHAERTTAIAAAATAFVLRAASGRIYTAGDARHGSLLARDTAAAAVADVPALVDALDGIAVAAVAAGGGWGAAALSGERDVYLWGGRAGEEEQGAVVADLRGVGADEVGVADVGGGEDVVGVGVGMGHVVVLTEGGRVWGVGMAGSGQLGGGGRGGFCEEWREIDVLGGRAGTVVEVVAGGWATFAVVERP
ncbi:regulator of chromosome condensation 1/beta-lactamase-inhibitor protein II [Morchella snyderi]|nr:regulator of chromosome condensation 1/beta-lactamase-inhibitor protein II [Morchella snyderi]